MNRWITMALLSGACAAAPAQTAAPLARDAMAERLAACTTCHGKEGRATNAGYFPRIAGKPAGYLYNQLLNFRDGRRQNAAMAYLLEHLSDDYLREIAEHFARLDLPYPPPQTRDAAPATLARGAALVRQGDAALSLPACTACHGERMTGALPAVPGPARPAARLPQCAARRLAQRPAARPAARLHGHHRPPPARSTTSVRCRCGCLRSPCRPTRRRRPRPRSSCRWIAVAPRHDGAPPSPRGRPRRPGAARGPRRRLVRVAHRQHRLDAGDRRGTGRGARGARCLPGARRQLRRLPHRPRRHALRRRAWHRHAVRHGDRVEPHARRRQRPRALVGRRLLARDAPRPLARRPPALPGLPLPQLHAASRARTAMRCTRTCAACRPSAAPCHRTGCASRTTCRPRWRPGARCTSVPRASSPTRSSRRPGTAAATWCAASATARPATASAMRWARSATTSSSAAA